MRKINIHDVASAADVSVATVDRVLNKRPGVRTQTRERVEAAMQKLHYRPDVHAAQLSRGRNYRFLFLLPHGCNSFIDRVADEVKLTAERMSFERQQIDCRFVEAFDGAAVAAALEALSPDEWDGVAVVCPDAPRLRQTIDDCAARGLHVVTMVSDLPGSARAHFIGIDNIAAGRCAGRLLGRLTAKPGRVAMVAGSMILRDHVERHLGCEQVLRAEFPHLSTLPVVEGRDDANTTERVVMDLLSSRKDIVALYNIGAGNRGLIRALDKLDLGKQLVVIAHELTPHSRKALLNDTFDAILCQDPAHEVRSAVRVLRALCDGTEIMRSQERIRIEIYLKENLP